jgi:uncharacterized SAM-binding protein YcdF (DUF218 family)
MGEALALYFLSPLSASLFLWLASGICWMLARRRVAVALASTGFVLLWLCSMPWLADRLVTNLESRYPALAPQATAAADGMIVLGGAVAGAKPPQRPTITLGPASSRVWHAAALYRSGKARWVVVAAGNRPERAAEQVEAAAIREMLVQLGVPASAILEEGTSRTTRENARNALTIVQRLGARRVLLVTSATHMPRAMQTFEKVWGPSAPELIPAVTDVKGTQDRLSPLELWLPSLDALLSVTRCLKEFAGMAQLAIIR